MRFKLTDSDGGIQFYIHALTPEVEAQIDRLGPNKIVSSAYDWPNNSDNDAYQGWVDQINVLWWPHGADQFATLLLTVDEYRAALVRVMIARQVKFDKKPEDHVLSSVTFVGNAKLKSGGGSATLKSASLSAAGLTLGDAEVDQSSDTVLFGVDGGTAGSDYAVTVTATTSAGDTLTGVGTIRVRATLAAGVADRPYLILQALKAPAEGATVAEGYAPAGLDPVLVETPFVEWKLYPLAPVRLPEADAADVYGGLWLLPLVDARYFWRLGPVSSGTGGSSSSGTASLVNWPLIDVRPTNEADWMPPLAVYPDDASTPLDYDPIADNGTSPAIISTSARGTAADLQAAMQGWRVVCRDVRSAYNADPITGTPHDGFTGIVSDYPDAGDATESYHLDAIRLGAVAGNLISGGPSDANTVLALLPRKLRVLFRVAAATSAYEVMVTAVAADPVDLADLGEDADGPTAAERDHLPRAVLGVPCPSTTPTAAQRNALVLAAQQWAILYYRWRRHQCFLKFPGVAPVIPNGYAHVIRWAFTSTDLSTTYVATQRTDPTDGAMESAGSSSSSSSDPSFLAVLTRKEYRDDTENITYQWQEVIDSGIDDDPDTPPLTYTFGPRSGTFDDHPVYHLRNIDLPVSHNGSGSSSDGSIDPLSVFRIWPGDDGTRYVTDGMPWEDLFRRTGVFDADGEIAYHRRLNQNTGGWEDGIEVRLLEAE